MILAQLVEQVVKVPPVLAPTLVAKAILAQLAELDFKVHSVRPAWPDYRVTWVQLVQQEQTAHVVLAVIQATSATPAQLVFKALPGHKVQEAILVQLVATETQAQLVELAQSVMEDISVLRVWTEQRVELARRVRVAHLAQPALLVIPVQLVLLEEQALLAQQALKVILVRPAPLVLRPQVRPAPLEVREILATKV